MASSASTSRSLARVAIYLREDQKENRPYAAIGGGNRFPSKRLKTLLNHDSSRLGQGEKCQEALHRSPVACDPQISRIQRVV
jgi:hypothetical protein